MSNKLIERGTLGEIFLALSTAGVASEGSIRARKIGDLPYFIGVDEAGLAVVLVSTVDTASVAPGIVTERVVATFGVSCTLELEGRSDQATLSLIRCMESDLRTVMYFLAVCETLVAVVGREPTVEALSDGVSRLASLFLRLAETAITTWTGLVGELVVLLSLSDVDEGIHAWRQRDSDRIDFVFPSYRLEAKATTSRVRRHMISYDQANPVGSIPVVIASMFVEYVDDGTSVASIIDAITGRSDQPAMQLKLRETVAQTLGAGVVLCSEKKIDLDLSTSTLQIYDAGTIPAIRGDLLDGVNHVSFESDFSIVDPLPQSTAGVEASIASHISLER